MHCISWSQIVKHNIGVPQPNKSGDLRNERYHSVTERLAQGTQKLGALNVVAECVTESQSPSPFPDHNCIEESTTDKAIQKTPIPFRETPKVIFHWTTRHDQSQAMQIFKFGFIGGGGFITMEENGFVVPTSASNLHALHGRMYLCGPTDLASRAWTVGRVSLHFQWPCSAPLKAPLTWKRRFSWTLHKIPSNSARNFDEVRSTHFWTKAAKTIARPEWVISCSSWHRMQTCLLTIMLQAGLLLRPIARGQESCGAESLEKNLIQTAKFFLSNLRKERVQRWHSREVHVGLSCL